MRTARPLPFLLAAGAVAVALAPLTRAGAAEHTVDIMGLSFIPEEISVTAGDTVTWVNRDEDDHDLGGSQVDSPVLKTGQTFTYTFDEAGDVEYKCKIHTYMTGIVHVGPGDGTQAPAPPPSEPPATTPTTAPTTTTTAGLYPPLGLVP